jgi:dTDP-4-dehydrorhamnose reductase
MRIIITGGSGLLGINCAIALRDDHEILLLSYSKSVVLRQVESMKVSLDNKDQLSQVVKDWGAQVIIHAAGITNVDYCEKYPDKAYETNVNLVKNVSEIALINNLKLVYISSDHLFDGGSPLYSEIDTPNPLNVYAKSKLMGEEAAKSVNKNCLIIRTNFFGWGSKAKMSFSDWVINSLRSGIEVNGYKDIFHTPIFLNHLSYAIVELIKNDQKGVFNVVGNSRISKYDFIILIAEIFGLDTSMVVKSSYKKTMSSIQRPLNMSLSNALVKNKLHINIPELEQGVLELLAQEGSGISDEIFNCIKS